MAHTTSPVAQTFQLLEGPVERLERNLLPASPDRENSLYRIRINGVWAFFRPSDFDLAADDAHKIIRSLIRNRPTVSAGIVHGKGRSRLAWLATREGGTLPAIDTVRRSARAVAVGGASLATLTAAFLALVAVVDERGPLAGLGFWLLPLLLIAGVIVVAACFGLIGAALLVPDGFSRGRRQAYASMRRHLHAHGSAARDRTWEDR